MSQRPAVRSGISPSNATLRTASLRPNALATARAASTSKPMAWLGSVTEVDGKYSIGGYSMSTQSVSVPGVMRLVGAGMLSLLGATEAAVAMDAAPVGARELPPPEPQPAANRVAAATAAMSFKGRALRVDPVTMAASSPCRIPAGARVPPRHPPRRWKRCLYRCGDWTGKPSMARCGQTSAPAARGLGTGAGRTERSVRPADGLRAEGPRQDVERHG